MSDLKPVGIRAVADGAAEYIASLQRMEEVTTAFVASLSPAVAAMNKIDSASAGAATAVSGVGRVSTAAGDDIADLAKATAAAETKAWDWGHATDAAGKEVDGLGKDADEAAKDVEGLGKQEKKAGDEADGLGDKSEKGSGGLNLLQQAAIGAARKLGEFAVKGAAAAGAAVLQFAKDGIKAAGDFEAGMNNFAAATGSSLQAAGLNLDDFKDLFISLGRDLPVSTAEVEQAAIEMAKGGIEPATIAAGGLRDTLQFAAAGGLSLSEAATIAAKAVGGWADVNATAAEKAALLAHAEDLMARAANASTVNVDDLAGGLYNVQGSARAAGVSLDDTVTTLAAVSSSFKNSFSDGTSFNNFLARIQPTTAPAADAMAQLNLLTADGKSKFYDATGAFIGMQNAAGLLQKATEGLSAAEKSETLQAIFGNDAKNVAVKLAELGAAGYADMAKAMAATAGVAEQAALKQQGFNTAVDNMMGSLEAFQITVGSAVLPILTKLINTISAGINVITDYADATLKGETALSTIAGVISSTFIPAVYGVTAALIAYNITALAPVLVNIPAMTAVLIYNTGAFIANAAAIAAAIAPYALIALAIGGVVKAYADFTSKVADATTALLDSRQWWVDSTTAIDDYAKETGAAKEALSPLNASIIAMRTQIQGEVEDLGKRAAAGLVSDAQMQTELATINQHRVGLQQATDAYNSQRAAIVQATAAQMTATAAVGEAKGPLEDLGDTASMTADDIDKLNKSLQDTYTKGQQAVQAYATTQSEFMTGVEARATAHKDTITALEVEKQKATTDEARKGIDDKIKAENDGYATAEQNAAQSYARQQAAQQQHLGQMLIDYTVAQAQLGNISKEKAAEITAALEKEYGLQENSVASTFLHMAGSIDTFSHNATGDVNDLIGTLRDQQHTAAETQKAMDDYAKEYVATATSNFLDAKSDADAYASAIEHIPSRKDTEVVTHYSHTGDRPGEGRDAADTPGRASGGPVDAMTPYIVGEQRPEVFVPKTDGHIYPSTRAYQQAAPSIAQMGASGRMGGNQTTDNSRTINMPIYTNQSPSVLQSSMAIVQAMLT